MKRVTRAGLGALCVLTLTFGCSSQQQEQMQEGVDGQQQEYAEDGQQALENGEQAADFNEDMADEGQMQGEMANGVDNLNLNEAEGEIPEDGLAAQENGFDAPEEQPADMANVGSDVADMGEDAMQGNMDSAPMAAGGNMAAAPTGNGARVYYVTTDNTPVMTEPSESSQKVNVMSQGDFTLLWVNGEWGKTQTGLYIPMKYMSSKGIARPKTQSAWR